MKYIKPELNVMEFDMEEIVTASVPTPVPQYLRQSNFDTKDSEGTIDFNLLEY